MAHNNGQKINNNKLLIRMIYTRIENHTNLKNKIAFGVL